MGTRTETYDARHLRIDYRSRAATAALTLDGGTGTLVRIEGHPAHLRAAALHILAEAGLADATLPVVTYGDGATDAWRRHVNLLIGYRLTVTTRNGWRYDAALVDVNRDDLGLPVLTLQSVGDQGMPVGHEVDVPAADVAQLQVH